jgi:2-oxoglutarate ferredoxin oxidoreductase subunit gamma
VANRTEIRITGFGGQGIVLAGLILARAAVVYDTREAAQTQSYGAESRGGACVSDVIIADAKIDYPICTAPAILVVMSAEAAAKHIPGMQPGGILLIDEDMVPMPPDGPYARLIKVPATRVAQDLKTRVVANVVMLGALIAIAPVVSREAVEQAVQASAPVGTAELNLQALRCGFALGEAAQASQGASV